MTEMTPANQPYDPVAVMNDIATQLAGALLNDSVNRARAAHAHAQLEQTQVELQAARAEVLEAAKNAGEPSIVEPPEEPAAAAPARRR